MFEVFESVQLLLALGCAALVVVVRGLLLSLPGRGLLLGAFALFLLGALLSVVGGVIPIGVIDLAEHLCHAASSLLLLLWVLFHRVSRTAP